MLCRSRTLRVQQLEASTYILRKSRSVSFHALHVYLTIVLLINRLFHINVCTLFCGHERNFSWDSWNLFNSQITVRLLKEGVPELVRSFGLQYEEVYIHDNVRNEIEHFCSERTLHQVYVEDLQKVRNFTATGTTSTIWQLRLRMSEISCMILKIGCRNNKLLTSRLNLLTSMCFSIVFADSWLDNVGNEERNQLLSQYRSSCSWNNCCRCSEAQASRSCSTGLRQMGSRGCRGKETINLFEVCYLSNSDELCFWLHWKDQLS